jgi:hypothetical protein
MTLSDRKRHEVLCKVKEAKLINPNNLAANVAMLTAAGLGVGAIGTAAIAGAGAASKPIDRAAGYRRMMRESPEFKSEDKKTVKKFYRTLHNFSPKVARDPVAASSYMKRLLAFKDVGVQPGDLQTLSGIEKSVADRRRGSLMHKAFDVSAQRIGSSSAD